MEQIFIEEKIQHCNYILRKTTVSNPRIFCCRKCCSSVLTIEFLQEEPSYIHTLVNLDLHLCLFPLTLRLQVLKPALLCQKLAVVPRLTLLYHLWTLWTQDQLPSPLTRLPETLLETWVLPQIIRASPGIVSTFCQNYFSLISGVISLNIFFLKMLNFQYCT